ncbi:MAG: hypothetical protein CM15mP95_3240 [Alphaproteobacteria bacterium]|nr:MAG: hypothetical protein CM15mP95_3240 [Alphaproteobacteria bacterium]
MSKHGYEAGRLNLPFVGLCSFGKFPYQPDWDSIDADYAILGAPFDFGTHIGLERVLARAVFVRHRRFFHLVMLVHMTMKMT